MNPTIPFQIIRQHPDIVPIDSIQPHERNINEGDLGAIYESIGENGFYGRIYVQLSSRRIIAGKHRWLAARQSGATEIPVELIDCDDRTALRILLADNRTARLGRDDEDALALLLKEIQTEQGSLAGTGYDGDFLDQLLTDLQNGAPSTEELPDLSGAHGTLASRFGVPPFSVLDARQGYWQERKNAWLSLGLRSFAGREEGLAFADSAKPPSFYALKNELRALWGREPKWDEVNAEAEKRGMLSAAVSGTSIFDPVLCELAYRWFCPEEGTVLDPFAGGSVRGLVAAKLGRPYIGIDLRAEQVEANRENWESFVRTSENPMPVPLWIQGDSCELETLNEVPAQCDFVFSCPPYADLEKYSDDPRDLSNMDYAVFLESYRRIIAASVARLREDRFACFVVGDVRDKNGFYRGFVSDTIRAFEDAGARFYNEAVLVTSVGSLAIRAGKQFESARKLGKAHQNCLVFVKGNAKTATSQLGAAEWGELKETIEISE